MTPAHVVPLKNINIAMGVSSKPVLNVAVGVILNTHGQVLLAMRPDHAEMGGYWEFPGGKFEAGETPEQALARELMEEVGIEVTKQHPFLQLRLPCPDKILNLHILKVTEFNHEAHGAEGQSIVWVDVPDLSNWNILPRSRAIVVALQLPTRYCITPEPSSAAPDSFYQQLEHTLRSGVRLVQLRAHNVSATQYEQLAFAAKRLCDQHHAQLILNCPADAALIPQFSGLHLTQARLMALTQRPIPNNQWLSAACHDEAGLEHAANIGVDFAVISPVLATPSHPNQAGLGWSRFAELVALARFPVYALGGMQVADIACAQRHGALGIAAVRGLWSGTGALT